MKRLAVWMFLCGLIVTAQATLVNWKVGDAGTTGQEWLFNTNGKIDVLPETDNNPYGDALACISNALHPDVFSWADGVWSGTAFSVTIDIPNNPVTTNPMKEVLVEVIYKGIIVDEWIMDNDWNDFEKKYSCDIDLGNGWIKRIDVWQIEPNPISERLCYGFNAAKCDLAAVDSIYVGTICIPEPITIMLLGLGAVILRKVK